MDAHTQYFFANGGKGVFVAHKMKDIVAVRQGFAGLEESGGRAALQFEKRPHDATVVQRPVVIGIQGITREGVFFGIPLLVEVRAVGIGIESNHGQPFGNGIVIPSHGFRPFGIESQFPPLFPIGFEVEHPVVVD